jgi:hypothetical protein
MNQRWRIWQWLCGPVAAHRQCMWRQTSLLGSFLASPLGSSFLQGGYILQRDLSSFRHRRLCPLAAGIAIAMGCLNAAISALAAPPVTTCADNNQPGSLRYAIANAQSGNTIDLSQLSLTCSTITLATGAMLGELTVSQPSLTIQGPPPNSLLYPLPMMLSGASNSRVFKHTGTGTLTLNYLTIANGRYAGSTTANGGCIASAGSVTLNQTTVTGCEAYASGPLGKSFGGGIYAADAVLLSQSIMSNNGSEGYRAAGGSIYAASVTAVNSTISGSSAYAQFATGHAYGGGLFVRGSTGVTLVQSQILANTALGFTTLGGGILASSLVANQSTISGNSTAVLAGGASCTDGGGGGVAIQDSLYLTSSTVDHNSTACGAYGGGVYLLKSATKAVITNSTLSGNDGGKGAAVSTSPGSAPVLYMYNSTVAFNSSTFAFGHAVIWSGNATVTSSIIADNVSGDLTVGGTLAGSNNLVVTYAASPPAGFNITTADPQLTPLSNHGGPTRVHALQATSPALGAGANPLPLTYDQRGIGYSRTTFFPKTKAYAPDIGAYQRQAVDDEIFYDGFLRPGG